MIQVLSHHDFFSGVRSVEKHVYGRKVQRKRPFQEYDDYSSRAKHTALDESMIKQHLKCLSHGTGLLQVSYLKKK